MICYRLTEIKISSPNDAFSGRGGLYVAGRWNSLCTLMVYTSQSPELCLLEILAHGRANSGEMNLWSITIPDQFISKLHKHPDNWDIRPSSSLTQQIGDKWAKEKSSVALSVNSVIIPLSQNILINPLHPKFDYSWITKFEKIKLDPRLTPASKEFMEQMKTSQDITYRYRKTLRELAK